MGIIIRKVKAGDERGVNEILKAGLKAKNFCYIRRIKPWNSRELKEAGKLYSSKNPSSYTLVAVDKEKNKIIGACHSGFKKEGRTRHVVDFGWFVHPNYQGKGVASSLMKKALDHASHRGFKRAEAEIAVKNTASLKLAKKFGFKVEGVKKKGFLTDEGEYIDLLVMGKLF